MEALHARYPFLEASREAVEAADENLATVITEEDPVVERALDRVASAIEDGTVGSPHRSTRIELLSYPAARVLVSLLDEPGLVDRYARAEARTAFERFLAEDDDGTELRSVSQERLDRVDLLRELGLERAVAEAEAGFRIDVATYLDLTRELDGEAWSLPGRSLSDGEVRVTSAEFDDLLREAIRGRVAEDLPLDVPGPIAVELEEAVAEVQAHLSDVELSWDVDEVDPARFPPCITGLLARASDGGDLEPHSRFALVSFLATVGMSGNTIADRVSTHPDVAAEAVREQVAHLRDEDEAVEYPPPSCATMQAYGDCVNKDALCTRIAHPMDYYERRLRGDEPADYA